MTRRQQGNTEPAHTVGSGTADTVSDATNSADPYAAGTGSGAATGSTVQSGWPGIGGVLVP